jgi:formylglycine-generating enzyme required for sulfatase activity
MWEYACRARTDTAFNFGPMISPEVANYYWTDAYYGVKFKHKKTFDGTVAVGHFPANPWGLYEMHGNVWEWCTDTWTESYAWNDSDDWYDSRRIERKEKVIRGGSWLNYPNFSRSATRIKNPRDDNTSFRVICLSPVVRSNN